MTIKDVEEAPSTGVWGKFKKTIDGFGDVSVRGDVDANSPDSVRLDIRANAFGTAIQVVGQAGMSLGRNIVMMMGPSLS